FALYMQNADQLSFGQVQTADSYDQTNVLAFGPVDANGLNINNVNFANTSGSTNGDSANSSAVVNQIANPSLSRTINGTDTYLSTPEHGPQDGLVDVDGSNKFPGGTSTTSTTNPTLSLPAQGDRPERAVSASALNTASVSPVRMVPLSE